MAQDGKLPERWRREKRASRAVQVAFDVGERVQNVIRREAVEQGLNPPDRVRQILGLPVNARPKRVRLSISLADEDFEALAREFNLDPGDRIGIKQKAAERLIAHVDETGERDE